MIREMISKIWRLFKHDKVFRWSVLCFVVALLLLLFPERRENVDIQSISEGGVTAYELYVKQPFESIQQIHLQMGWSIKRDKVKPDDTLFALRNAGVWMTKAKFDELQLPNSPERSYLFEYDLCDDVMELRAAPLAAAGTDKLPAIAHELGRNRFVKSSYSQYLLIDEKLVKINHLRAQIVVDLLLPKIIAAVFAALGTAGMIAFLLLRYGKVPEGLLARKLLRMVIVVVVGMGAALAMCGYYRSQGAIFPYDTFLFPWFDRFNDLLNTFTVVRFLDNPYSSQISGTSYFPFAYLLLKLTPAANSLYVIFSSYILFLVFYLVSAFAVCCRRGWLTVTGVLLILLLNYPLWYLLDRGNTDFWVYLFIFLFVWYYRKGQHWAAILFLIAAVNFKLYPAILAVLYLKDRAYGKFGAAALGSILVFVLCLGCYDWNLAGLLANLKIYSESYTATMSGINSGHSLFGLFKILTNRMTGMSDFSKYAEYYVFAVAAIAFFVSGYVIFVGKVFWKNLYLLLAMMLLLPHVSFDYRMIVLIIPALYFLIDDTLDSDWQFYSFFWGLLLMPIHFVFAWNGDNQLSIYLRPLLLGWMVLWIMVDGWRQRRRERLT